MWKTPLSFLTVFCVIRSYLHAVGAFRRYTGKRLDHLGPDDIRRYQAHLVEEKKLAKGTVVIQVSALRFLHIVNSSHVI